MRVNLPAWADENDLKGKKVRFFMGNQLKVIYFHIFILSVYKELCALINYRYELQGSCSWESMKSPFNDRRFINRRNFQNEQAPSVVVWCKCYGRLSEERI